MKKALILALAAMASLSIAGGASAQIPPLGEDVVGLYTNDFDGPTWAHYEGLGPQVTVYLIYTNLSRPGIAGWECGITQTGAGVMHLSTTFLGTGPISLFPHPNYQVGLGVPMTTTDIPDVWPVATLLYFVLSNEATTLGVDRIVFTSWPDDPGPGYANAEDVGDLPRAYSYTGVSTGTVFGFNTGPMDPPVRIDDTTWGGVKGMFR